MSKQKSNEYNTPNQSKFVFLLSRLYITILKSSKGSKDKLNAVQKMMKLFSGIIFISEIITQYYEKDFTITALQKYVVKAKSMTNDIQKLFNLIDSPINNKITKVSFDEMEKKVYEQCLKNIQNFCFYAKIQYKYPINIIVTPDSIAQLIDTIRTNCLNKLEIVENTNIPAVYNLIDVQCTELSTAESYYILLHISMINTYMEYILQLYGKIDVEYKNSFADKPGADEAHQKIKTLLNDKKIPNKFDKSDSSSAGSYLEVFEIIDQCQREYNWPDADFLSVMPEDHLQWLQSVCRYIEEQEIDKSNEQIKDSTTVSIDDTQQTKKKKKPDDQELDEIEIQKQNIGKQNFKNFATLFKSLDSKKIFSKNWQKSNLSSIAEIVPELLSKAQSRTKRAKVAEVYENSEYVENFLQDDEYIANWRKIMSDITNFINVHSPNGSLNSNSVPDQDINQLMFQIIKIIKTLNKKIAYSPPNTLSSEPETEEFIAWSLDSLQHLKEMINAQFQPDVKVLKYLQHSLDRISQYYADPNERTEKSVFKSLFFRTLKLSRITKRFVILPDTSENQQIDREKEMSNELDNQTQPILNNQSVENHRKMLQFLSRKKSFASESHKTKQTNLKKKAKAIMMLVMSF